jgi:hypothetical protein
MCSGCFSLGLDPVEPRTEARIRSVRQRCNCLSLRLLVRAGEIRHILSYPPRYADVGEWSASSSGRESIG